MHTKITFGIRLKTIIAATVLVVFVAGVLSIFFTKQVDRIIHADLKQMGEVLASNLAYNAEYGVLADNTDILKDFIKGVMQQSQVAYCVIQDIDGNILVAQGLENRLKAAYHSAAIQAIKSNSPVVQLVNVSDQESYYDVAVPIISKQKVTASDETSLFDTASSTETKSPKMVEKRIGTVRVGLSLEEVKSFQQRSQNIAIVITALIILLAGAITTFVSGIAVQPIQKLVEAMKKIAKGELNVKIPSKGRDEITYLTESFNQMTEDLSRSRDELLRAKDFTDNILRSMVEILIVVNPKGKIISINPAAVKVLGYTEQELIEKDVDMIFTDPTNDEQKEFRSKIADELVKTGFVTEYEMKYKTKDGSMIPVVFSASVMRDKRGRLEGIVGIARDITERKLAESLIELKNKMLEKVNADLLANEIKLNNMVTDLRKTNEELKKAQTQLIQSEKLASIGQLAAGIAHEINNPLGYVGSNLSILDQYIKSIMEIIGQVGLIKQALKRKDFDSAATIGQNINDLEEKLNLKTIITDLNSLLSETLNGIERISLIVKDMKSFARQDIEGKAPFNLNKIFEGVIHIVKSELKYKADLKQELGEIPMVECNGQQIGQVFINLLVNAAQAIKDRGTILVKTYYENGRVFVKVSDTGEGIPHAIMDKIFDPFFTTKEPGKGTGLGLSISYELVKGNDGDIFVESEVGKGTTFVLSFPAKIN